MPEAAYAMGGFVLGAITVGLLFVIALPDPETYRTSGRPPVDVSGSGEVDPWPTISFDWPSPIPEIRHRVDDEYENIRLIPNSQREMEGSP